jgi:hypothetical protein
MAQPMMGRYQVQIVFIQHFSIGNMQRFRDGAFHERKLPKLGISARDLLAFLKKVHGQCQLPAPIKTLEQLQRFVEGNPSCDDAIELAHQSIRDAHATRFESNRQQSRKHQEEQSGVAP